MVFNNQVGRRGLSIILKLEVSEIIFAVFPRQSAAYQFGKSYIGTKLPFCRVFLGLSGLSCSDKSPSDQQYSQYASPEASIGNICSFPLRCKAASFRTPLLIIGLFFAFVMCFVVRWGWKDWDAKPLAGVLGIQVVTGVMLIVTE